MPFDPDKYLESKSTGFNPDDYLKKKGQEEPSEVGSEVGGLSTIPVQDLPLAYEESKAGLFDKLAESIQTPQEKSGFRTVQEMGKAKLPSGVTMEKTKNKPIDFDAEDRRIEAEQKEQREVARLNVKDKYETIKPKLDEFKGIISQQKSDLDAQYNYTRQTLDELKRADQLDINAPDVSELVQNYDRLGKETEEKNKQLKNIENAELFVKDLENIINGKNKKFSEGVYQTTVKMLAFDGIAEIKRNFDLKKISDKIANGEDITADEQLAIASYGLLNEAQSNFQSGIGYDVGRSLVEMVPYLFSFAVTGGISKGIQTGIMSALKSTGEKTIKELAKKGIAYVSGQAVRPAFFSSLYSSGIEKQIGQVETTKDLLPSIAEGTKESPQKAFAKAYANTMAEIMTEQLGEVAVPIFNKIIGKEVKQALNLSMIDKIKDATAFNGFLPEMGEEFANEVLNTAIEGRPAEEIFDPRKILTTALTVGIMSSGFALSNTAYKAAINKKEQESGFKLDTKTKKQIDAIIESDKDTEEKAKELSYIVDEKIKAGAKNDEISNIVQYATSHTAKMKLDEVEPEIQKGVEKKAQDEVKTKSEPKAPSEEKTTERPKEEKPVEKEAAPHEKAYEESIAKKSEEDLAKMPTYSGKKFSLATILPNGDISNVYVRSEGQSHKTYMSPEDATAYEEGRMTLGYWSPAEQKFMEAPQKGKEFGQKVMDIAASKVKIPEVETKITEEPSYAERIPKIEGQVSPGGDAIKEGEGEGGQNLQFDEKKESKAGYKELKITLNSISPSIFPLNDPNAFKTASDGINRTSKFLSNISSRKSIIEKGFNSADRNIRSLMLGSMQRSFKDDKVFRIIIQSVPVNMMNDFIGEKFSSDNALSYKDVFMDKFSSGIRPDFTVSEPVLRIIESMFSSLPSNITISTAKDMLISNLSGLPKETISAIFTNKSFHGGKDINKYLKQQEKEQQEPKQPGDEKEGLSEDEGKVIEYAKQFDTYDEFEKSLVYQGGKTGTESRWYSDNPDSAAMFGADSVKGKGLQGELRLLSKDKLDIEQLEAKGEKLSNSKEFIGVIKISPKESAYGVRNRLKSIYEKSKEQIKEKKVEIEPEQPGDEKKGLTYSEMETQLDELNTSINKMKEENANEFKKDGTIKAKSKLFGSYRALNDMRSGLLEQMQGSYQEEFTKRAREESEKSRVETEQINKAFEERQQELKKNIPPEELKEIETDNEVQRIFDKVSGNEVPTQEEINFVNENAYLPKGFEFGEKGLQKVKEKEPSQPEIEPEVAKKLRSVANKIREGKISRIQGFKADTPFTLAWDGGLEVLATTLEATADLTVAIDNALTHIKNTEWYKNLTKDRQVEFDKKFEEHIDKELGDEYRDATKHKFVNKDVEERFNQAVIHPKTFMDKAKEAFTDLRDKILRTYKDLPKNKRFAEAYNAINQFQKGVEISSSKAGDIITRILGKMSKPDYELFTKKIIFDDLLETIKMNPVYELPYGLTEETLKQELDNINKFVAFNAKVKDAIKKRKEVYKEVQSEYVDYANKIGVKTDGYFERNDYFRHQVLLYSEASKGTIERKGSPLSRPKKLSLFKERVQGRGLDINRNYIESEFEVFNKLLYAIEKMKMIDNIYRNYDIMKDLKAKAKEELGEEATRAEINRWIEDNIPDGYVIDSPENMNIFMAQSVPESLVQDLLLGNVEEMGIKRDDLRKIFALGAAKKIVIPTEIYKTMDNISRVNDKDRFAQFSKKLLTGWKIWTLIQPKRFFKYNIRNLTGDSEAVFLGNPRVFKKTLASARELYDVFVSKDIPSPDMNEYISRGGLQLVLTTQEIGELRKVKEFEKYYDNKRNLLSKAWDGYWKTAKLTTDFREQLLRYAAYKEWLSEIDKNNGKVKNYGASNREFIDGLESKYDKAFRLSNELLGAYDQISEAGQNLRSYWIPFWSFQEINFRRTNQMFLNALDSEKSLSGKSLKGIEFAAKKVPFIAWKATKLSIKLSGFWAMTAVWNGLLFGDEEDELPEEIKSKPHIVFGRNPDGTIRYLSRLGVMGDYLEWFGMDSMPMYINEWLAGRMSTSDIAKDMVLSAPNKLVNGVNPYVKTTAELIFRKSLFPDISKPRAIRDFGEQIAINLGLKDEYRAISKLPDKPYYNSLRKMFWDEIDPLATAYWNIASYKSDFKKKQGKDEKGSYSFTDKSLALYYYKQALMYGDTKSAEYHLDRYIMLGGTKRGYNTSMSYLNPMRGIKEEEKDEFIKFLGKENKYLLDQAMKYYDKVLNLKLDWPDDKLEEELDTVEIPL